MNRNRRIIFTALIVFCCLTTGCAQRYLKNLNLEPVSEIKYNEKWAVITSPYTSFYEEPKISKNSTKHGRKGEIFEIKGKKTVILPNREQFNWYKFDEGWIEETDIFVCNNKLQAQKYSEDLMSK